MIILSSSERRREQWQQAVGTYLVDQPTNREDPR